MPLIISLLFEMNHYKNEKFILPMRLQRVYYNLCEKLINIIRYNNT